MLKKITPMPVPQPDPDRVLDCAFYLEPAVVDIVGLALEAGWSSDEVEAALFTLARHRALDRIEPKRAGG